MQYFFQCSCCCKNLQKAKTRDFHISTKKISIDLCPIQICPRIWIILARNYLFLGAMIKFWKYLKFYAVNNNKIEEE